MEQLKSASTALRARTVAECNRRARSLRQPATDRTPTDADQLPNKNIGDIRNHMPRGPPRLTEIERLTRTGRGRASTPPSYHK